MPETADLHALLPDRRGGPVYVRKRPVIDWDAAFAAWRDGETQEKIAARLGVSRRTVIRNLKPLKKNLSRPQKSPKVTSAGGK